MQLCNMFDVEYGRFDNNREVSKPFLYINFALLQIAHQFLCK